MKANIKNAVEEYQCSGCISGSDISCFEENKNNGIGCGKHHAGTIIFPGVGNIYLGMPKGFCRLGEFTKMKPIIFDRFEDSDWDYVKFNIPVWKYLSKEGYTIIRGLSPRTNNPFIQIFLEDCRDKINCLELSQTDIDSMD
jgi:hypothetical protein